MERFYVFPLLNGVFLKVFSLSWVVPVSEERRIVGNDPLATQDPQSSTPQTLIHHLLGEAPNAARCLQKSSLGVLVDHEGMDSGEILVSRPGQRVFGHIVV